MEGREGDENVLRIHCQSIGTLFTFFEEFMEMKYRSSAHSALYFSSSLFFCVEKYSRFFFSRRARSLSHFPLSCKGISVSILPV